jgi:RimJ/RimL family protein N-acetyltransferase
MANSPSSIILGSSIYFRPPEKGEIPVIRELWEQPETPEDIKINSGFNDNDLEAWYNNLILQENRKCFYNLVYSKHPELVGEVMLYSYNEDDSSARLFLRILEEHRMKGFGRDAMELILHYFFFRWGGHIIYCEPESDNFLAQRILMKFGFESTFEETGKYRAKMTLNQFIALYGQEFT